MTRHRILEGEPNETGEVADPIPHDDQFNPVYDPGAFHANDCKLKYGGDTCSCGYFDHLGDISPNSVEEIEITVPDPDDYVHVKETDVNQLVPSEAVAAEPKKPEFKDALHKLFSETLFSRIRAGNFKGFRMPLPRRGAGISARTVGREIERLKKLGLTPKSSRKERVGMAHGQGSINVKADALQLSDSGDFQAAIELLQTWEPHYGYQKDLKAELIEFWKEQHAMKAVTIIDDTPEVL